MRFNKTNDALPPAYGLGAWVLILSGGVLLVAFAFEFIGGYTACPLCLQQRYAYYAAIVVSFIGLVLLSGDHARVAGFLFFALALAFLSNAGLGVYHAGIEWGFWPGPDTCAGASAPPGSVESLMKELETATGARCDEAQWRFFGLSFAGWNVVISFVLFLLALKAALAANDHTSSSRDEITS